MKVMLIGGTGFIGSELVRRLLEHGHTVALFHRGITNVDLPTGVQEFLHADSHLPITTFPLDLLRFRPEVVIHTMAMGHADSAAAAQFFENDTGRIVMLSSGDVYAAYGRFLRIEHGSPDPNLLNEDSPLRTAMFLYRAKAQSKDDLFYWYEKVLAEKYLASSCRVPTTILRLPKVYGGKKNAELATLFAFSSHSDWRWTHGYVGNIAEAIALAATHRNAANEIYLLGESYTPTIRERLAMLPPSTIVAPELSFDFRHNVAYDTGKIRTHLGFAEIVSEIDAMIRTMRGEII